MVTMPEIERVRPPWSPTLASLGEGVGLGETEGQPCLARGPARRRVSLKRSNHGDRAETASSFHDGGAFSGDVGQHRRLEEVALVADALAAGPAPWRPCPARRRWNASIGVDAARIGQRPHAGVGFHTVAHLGLLGDIDELADEVVVDLTRARKKNGSATRTPARRCGT